MDISKLMLGGRGLCSFQITQKMQGWQQCRFYQPKKLNKWDLAKLHRVTKPFIPTSDHPNVQEWQLKPEVQKSYKREAWAKFGAASGVDLKEILPTRKEIEEEWEAEIRWWPTFQEMKDEIRRDKELEEKEKRDYEKRVAENMAKMPQWIEQWEKEQRLQKEREEQREVKRELMKEKALEELDYKYNPNSAEFKSYLRDMAEKERLDKKKSKKMAKTAKTKNS